ncbi:MAG: sodium:calcium antiporter [Chitinivibrionales bacterium]|nr:sodium:calcium antiporter [Chitinivibrionales bacterium]
MNFDPAQWPLWAHVVLFGAATAVVAVFGARLSRLADQLADMTGMGEALMGGIFLGASTSLSGLTAAAVAAADGYPQLSLSNAIGGIAAQMVMLTIADIAYTRANLEHAAASPESLMQGCLQTIMLGLVLFIMLAPAVSFLGVNMLTPLLPIAYAAGMFMVRKSLQRPMWSPRKTDETRTDQPQEQQEGGRGQLVVWVDFLLSALAVMAAGWGLTRAAERIATDTFLSQSLVGGLFVAVSTSFAELVTSVAAVRRGALTLAVSGILGGNAFDVLFVAVSDVFYREGSIYQAVSYRERSLLALTVVMTGVLLLGLLKRDERGFARIGFESISIIFIYLAGIVLLSVG